jgi:hypothetical protein
MERIDLPGVSLTPERETISLAATLAATIVPGRLRADFIKAVGDRLRPIRDGDYLGLNWSGRNG